jgi:uncharacterized circularly permuted ATP-grasp superfamily protein
VKMSAPIVGPIAPYSNVPIQPDNYQPRRFVISSITLGRTTLVTTEEDHDYVIGQLVRLVIPKAYGTRELNQVTGYVIEIPQADQVVLDIYSSNFNIFIAADVTDVPQIIPVGDINSGVQNTSGRINQVTYIPGSFINIS